MKAANFAAIMGTKGRLTIPKENRKALSNLLREPLYRFEGAIVRVEIKSIYIDGRNYDLETQALIRD